MVKLIIFDLDGTLLDTSQDIHNVLNDALTKFSLPTVSKEKTLSFVGDGAKQLVERAVGEIGGKSEEVYAEFSKNYSACNNDNTFLYDGEEEALKNFSATGIKLAIATNKPKAAGERVYCKFLAKFGFCEVLCQTKEYPLKPNPASTLHILDVCGVDKSECLFVGDDEADILTARNAGIKSVAVLWGFRSRSQLEKAGATVFAESFKELEEIVFKS